MPGMKIILDGDNCWPDLKEKGFVELEQDLEIAMLQSGMASGAPSVSMRFELPDGRTMLAQTSLKLFLSAARAFRGCCEHLGVDLDGV
jgi:hypothetical protein